MAKPSLLPVALLALLAACGHRGDPQPPLRKTPPTPAEFRLAQRGELIELSVTAPLASVDGVRYQELTIEFLHGTGQADLEKKGGRRIVRAQPGTLAVAALPLPAPGTLVRAAARATVGGEHGQRTLTKALIAQAPLEAPRELVATLAEDGIALAWRGVRPKAVEPPSVTVLPGAPGARPAGTSPAAAPRSQAAQPTPSVAPPPAQPPAPAAKPEPPREGEETAAKEKSKAPAGEPAASRRNGFLVYRRPAGQRDYGAPLDTEPLDRRNLADTTAPLGASVCYVVRAAASMEPLIESAASNEVCVERRDISAPAAPAGLAILPRQGGLELLWSPSAEADLAGYRVYRAAASGAPEKLAELPLAKASYLDETVRQGTVYRYTLTAVDQAGNESEPTEAVEATLP